MALNTAKTDLLITEAIHKKPVLRTRFTSQAYFVLAMVMDLLDQGVLVQDGGQLTIADEAKFDALPAFLANFQKQFRDTLTKTEPLAKQLQFLTSWDIANDLYDGIGPELLQQKVVEKVTFQNNLEPHIIYVPTDGSRNGAINDLKQTMQLDVPHVTMHLVAILEQQDALKWLIPDAEERNQLLAQFHAIVDRDPYFEVIQELTATASEVFIQKKFWLDSWLS
ncbi:hypothetical protein AYR62_01590 [Secundilactobacillus paracollinoides]|uniref:Uncharacterized protein n=1 Tax=Secundilactobacillus paracollinoides TaxID=240427 RepID=A0A1B2IV28_9LACO|nr:hypothetical protein [Secundilactobacillus paracollinoides]ANZ60122.1 hypothetical protein AYR61_01335 [Secundilactobacillus paracollinoides]ANZ62924.1 hypothetical protein AYR62_01590 [Secundilactobacillus paracollinoides]ANZ65916.1 hypothetical protein AYR63_01355 [Secundilactobacillus paracollinoides]KRL78386.1 hypothetical protein FC17_GL000973 [Secundilactobacillus paracollinoides DSM 15502 = JCM 11969]